MSELYAKARELAEKGDIDGCWKILSKFLIEDPYDIRSLIIGSFMMRRAGRLPEAYHFAKAVTNRAPYDAAGWIVLGHVASEMWLVKESEASYRRALKCPNVDQNGLEADALLNLSALYIDNGRYDEALPLAQGVLEGNPDSGSARANIGFCQIAMGDWSGWGNYRSTLGSDWRPKTNYKGEKEWDGTKDQTVVLYGEQGIGDEISFASMLPDAIRHCRKVILDCDPRLKGLFQRSFPGLSVHGTRMAKTGQWPKEDWEFDASLALGQIGEYFRTTEESFPRTPYLMPCPTRKAMWKSLFKGKPAIGIAWSGGVAKTGMRQRRTSLQDWLPLFQSVDAHFVCLQYRDAENEIKAFRKEYPFDLVQYPWATLTGDYDDTAALVGALDCVVGVPTSVVHLSGAVGTKTFAMKAQSVCWQYQAGLPFHPATIIEYEGTWQKTIQATLPLVLDYLGSSSDTTRDSPSPTTSFNTRLSGMPAIPYASRR